MTVRLIAITKPVIEGATTAGELIAYCARVSNPANQDAHDTAPRLLRYLAKHRHWSPFEMASMVVEIVTSRDIARQILRHRSLSFQEYSGRYAEMPDEIMLRAARLQDPANRQNSLHLTPQDAAKDSLFRDAQEEVAQFAHKRYAEALRLGIAKEQARALLPEGLTRSTLFASGTVRSWLHYCDVRCGPETQAEHREIAQGVRAILLEQLPELAEIVGGE